jgi:HSP20 family protein
MLSEMETRFSSIMKDLQTERLLPAPGFQSRMAPALRGEFSVDVREYDDEILVVADLPGVEKGNISITLIDPSTLEISTSREEETEEKKENYYLRERIYGAMSRRICFPAEIEAESAKATFNNGVLELRLKKVAAPPERRIPIE